MASRVAQLRLQLLDQVSGPAKKTSGALGQLERDISKLGKNGVAGAKNLGNQLDHLRRKAAAAADFGRLRQNAASTFAEFRTARDRVKQLEAALASVTKPTAKMNADLRSARSALKGADNAFRQSRAAAVAAGQGLKTFGLNSRTAANAQEGLRRSMAQTIRKMREMERENRKQPPRPGGRFSSGVGQAAALVGGTSAVYAGRNVARRSLESGLSFDEAYHRRDAIGGFNSEESARLNQQAERIGKDTEFTNADVVNGQKTILQSGIRNIEQIEFLTDAVSNYSRAMGVTLEQGSQSLTSMALVKGVNLSDNEAVQKLVDRQVWMSKNSGMTDEDLRQFNKYGGTAGRTAGLSDDTLSAVGMTLRRAGIGGDEAGVAGRALSSKLVAPTRKGRLALQTMGVNYNDYVTSPEAFNLSGFEAGLKENFGVRLTEELRDKLMTAWDDEFSDPETGELVPVASDTGEFTTQTMEVLENLFGDMSASDQKRAAKYMSDFQRMSAGSVDAERLLGDILAKDPTLLQSNAMFTDKQGGRIAILAKNRQNFDDNRAKMAATPDGVAKRIGDESTSGLAGDWMRMTGSLETTLTRISQDWEGVTRPLIRGIDGVVETFLELPPAARRVVEALGAMATVMAGYATWQAGKGLLGRALGTGGAAAAGGIGGGILARGAGLAGRIAASPLGAGALTATALNQTDPDGNLWGLTSGVDAWVEKHTGINPSNVQLGRKRTPQEALEVDISQQTAQWPIAAQQGIREYIGVLMTGGAEAEAKAQATGEQIKEALTVNGALTIDTSQLERALGLARQFATVARGGSAAVSSSGGSLDPKLDGKRAGGGRVKAGGLYQINEKGQELFAPGADGTIIPNHKLGGGGVTVHAPINLGGITVGAGADAASVKAAVQQGVEQALAQLDAKLSRSLETTWSNLAYGDA